MIRREANTAVVPRSLAVDRPAPRCEEAPGAEPFRAVGRRAGTGVATGWLWLALVLAFAMVFRVWIISDPSAGHASDLRLFARWTTGLGDEGLAGFYATESFCDYPPLSVLIMWGVGKVSALVGATGAGDALLRVLIKVPACMADLGIALLLFAAGCRRFGHRAGVAAAGLYVLNPVSLYDSAYWGQVDSIYTMFSLAALVFALNGRQRWSGIWLATALLAKFQAIALVPIVVFEAYRRNGWRGLRRMGVTGVVTAGLILAPFAITGTADDVLHRAYVKVVGQYHDLAKGAYNIWPLIAPADRPDTAVPVSLVVAAADGANQVSRGDSWLLQLTYRRISLMVYALVVAVVLSAYSLRPSARWCFGAGGALALAFYLFPTEMHERYGFPAIAFLALWAAGSAARERIYMLCSVLMLLNMAAMLPPTALAKVIGMGSLLVLVVLTAWLLVSRSSGGVEVAIDDEVDEPPGRRRLIPAFRWATLAGVLLAGMMGGGALYAAGTAAIPGDAGGRVYLDSLLPRALQQGWGQLHRKRSVTGGPLQIGDRFFLRGIGTHAPSQVLYEVPPGATVFHGLVGLDAASGPGGHAVARIVVDGEEVFVSEALRVDGAPIAIELPMKGARHIILSAETADGEQAGDHVNWVEAWFAVPDRP